MGILIFILLSYGISNIVVYGSIFNGFRDFWSKFNPSFFGKLFTCMMCFPTWVGFVLSTTFQLLGYDTPMVEYGIDNIYLAIFLDGCLTSGGVWLLHTVQEYLEFNSTEEVDV